MQSGVVEGLKIIIISTMTVKENQLLHLNIALAPENQVPLMRSGVVEELRLIVEWNNGSQRECSLWLLQIFLQSSENQIPLMQSGVVEGLNSLLLSPSASATDKGKEQAARAIANISVPT